MGSALGRTLKNLNWSLWPTPEEAATSFVWRASSHLLREPALLVTTVYALMGFLGLWSSYWFYAGFDVPVLEYLQVSDYLVAGLRSPVYPILLLIGIVSAVLISLPEMVELRHPEEVKALRARHWGWYLLFPPGPFKTWQSIGFHPFTGVWVTLACVVLMGSAMVMMRQAADIRSGIPHHPVQVHLTGDPAPSKDAAQLLGTSTGFVYLWWPQRQQAEVVPVGAVRRLVLPVRKDAKKAKADKAGPAARGAAEEAASKMQPPKT